MHTLFKNAHVISPDLEQHNAFVSIEDDTVVQVSQDPLQPNEHTKVIDLEGKILCPGFIDIHAHGADGRDVSNGSLESIHHIAKRKLQEGVTTWLPTTLTLPIDQLEKTLRNCSLYHQNPIHTKCPGIHLEGPFLNPDYCGAQHPDHIQRPCLETFKKLQQLCNISIFSLAPCQSNSLELIQHAKQQGITCSAAHTAATADQLKAAIYKGITHLTHFGNAMSGLHHREIGTLGMGLLDSSLMLELIPDGHHLSPEFIQLVFSLKPIDSLILITDSTAASWTTSNTCKLGRKNVKIHNGKATLTGTDTLAGSTLKYNEALKLTHQITNIPLTQLIKTTSYNQARSLGIERVGKIEPSYLADLVIMNTDFSIVQTYVNGVLKT